VTTALALISNTASIPSPSDKGKELDIPEGGVEDVYAIGGAEDVPYVPRATWREVRGETGEKVPHTEQAVQSNAVIRKASTHITMETTTTTETETDQVQHRSNIL
jgi:hypothetical protein